MRRLEFWPDYDDRLLVDEDAKQVALDSLGLPEDLLNRAKLWVAAYDDLNLPGDTQGDVPIFGNVGDAVWLAEGATLLAELRSVLAPEIELFVTEDWWGEPGTD